MNSRIGIMGGMFDPVHTGHLQVALTARNILHLDRILLVPCGIPNHRNMAWSTPEQRLEMLRLATSDYPELQIDEREVRRAGVSFTFDTLTSIKRESPGSTLYFILGMDSFSTLPTWHRWRELFDLCHFIVVKRPGHELDSDAALVAEMSSREVSDPAAFEGRSHGLVCRIDGPNLTVSSSQVRERIAKHERLDSLLAPEVIDYMGKHKLYMNKAKG